MTASMTASMTDPLDADATHPWSAVVYDRTGNIVTTYWVHSLRALVRRLDEDHRDVPAAVATSWALRERAHLHRHASGWVVASRHPLPVDDDHEEET